MQIQHLTKNKDKWIKIRCTERDREYIKQKAKDKGLSLSALVRMILKENLNTK